MNMLDIAWTAGFFEGEAWFGSSNKNGTPVISVSQVQREPLNRLLDLFGGTVRAVSGNGLRQDFWRWELYGYRSAGLMMTVFSFMSSKRKSAIRDVLIKWRDVPDPRRKLSWNDVHEIRATKNTTMAALAASYGVKTATIQAVLENRTWRMK